MTTRLTWTDAARLMSAGGVFGVFMALAFPPIGLWGCAFVAPLGLIWAATRPAGRSWARAFWSALGTIPFWIYAHVWMIEVTTLGFPILVLAIAAFNGAFVWLVGRLRERLPGWPVALTAPVVWVGLETLRGEWAFHGYAWFYVGHALIDAPAIPKTAAILGVGFVSWCAVLPAALWAQARFARGGATRFVRLVGGASGLIVVLAAGAGPMSSTRSVRIGVVQTNVPQDNKLDWTPEQQVQEWLRLVEFSRAAAAANPPPQLVVWPETMKPGLALDPVSVKETRDAGMYFLVSRPDGTRERLFDWEFADQTLALQTSIGVPMLIGEDSFEGLKIVARPQGGVEPRYARRFNSVFLVRDGQVQPERYDKIRLTPFGEEMPYIRLWPWLNRQVIALGARGMRLDLSSGAGPVTFPLEVTGGEPVRFATPICFEATDARLCRRLVAESGGRRADVLVNLTNDGWFSWWDPAREWHLQLARWRCVELGTPMVRAANTGISCIIDGNGQVVRRTLEGGGAVRSEGVLVGDVPVPAGMTTFARLGGVFSSMMLALSAGALVTALMQGRKHA